MIDIDTKGTLMNRGMRERVLKEEQTSKGATSPVKPHWRGYGCSTVFSGEFCWLALARAGPQSPGIRKITLWGVGDLRLMDKSAEEVKVSGARWYTACDAWYLCWEGYRKQPLRHK